MADRNERGQFLTGHANFSKKGKRPNFHGNKGSFHPGLIPWNSGKGESVSCKECNVLFYAAPWEMRRRNGKQFCSKQCAYKGRVLKSIFKAGKEHPAWIDGKSRTGYPPIFNRYLKNKIKKRDKFVCQLCFISEEEHRKKIGKGLCVNHIDFNKKNCDEKNLNTLCIKCNCKINWDREKWTNHFRSLVPI